MSQTDFGFYFERAGRAASQGAIAPAEQFFEGSIAEVSLARETGQNSIDARAGNDPVVMTFELADVSTDEIPGIVALREHLAQVEEQTRGSEGHERMSVALESALKPIMPVLRIGDSGTTGLAGSESQNDPNSPLSALTRGAGISSSDGSRGGSFGIGSAVGPMASSMCTVLYTSLPQGEAEVVLAGYSRLASHRDIRGTWRMGDGFYTDLTCEEDFRYMRDPAPLTPFARRTQPGTDVFVLGYRKAGADPDLEHIRTAFMNNFLMAIHRGGLVVEGVTAHGAWRLDSQTLEEHVKSVPEAAAFYRAVHDPEPIETLSRRFGKLSLYVDVDDSMEKALHTITLRKPLMKIETFKHYSIPAKYAAVLECADEKGNQLLRQLEPPQHDRWDAGRAVDGATAIAELKTFVREGLKSRVRAQVGEQVEIKGLSKYLPADTFLHEGVGEEAGRVPQDGAGTTEESSTIRGADAASRSLFNGSRRSVRIGVRTAATAEGADVTRKGRDRGGDGTRKDDSRGLTGTGSEGEGNSRIESGDIRFRSWSNPSSGVLCIALTPSVDVTGDLELVALGPGGSVEEDYVLPISEASIVIDGESEPVAWTGNVFSGISLRAGATARLQLTLSSSHRFRLAVK